MRQIYNIYLQIQFEKYRIKFTQDVQNIISQTFTSARSNTDLHDFTARRLPRLFGFFLGVVLHASTTGTSRRPQFHSCVVHRRKYPPTLRNS